MAFRSSSEEATVLPHPTSSVYVSYSHLISCSIVPSLAWMKACFSSGLRPLACLKKALETLRWE